MNPILWCMQIVVAAIFLYSGICKSTLPEAKLVSMGQTGVDGLPIALTRFIGITEILGVFGLILPWWLHVLPILTPVSALSFAIIMIPAARIHYRRKEPKNVLTNCILFIACIFISYYRALPFFK